MLSDQPVPFTIDGSEAVVTVTQYNMPQKGQLTITKTGEVFASVQENDGLYQPVYEVAGLPGAVYDVIADEDIYTGDGTLRARKRYGCGNTYDRRGRHSEKRVSSILAVIVWRNVRRLPAVC